MRFALAILTIILTTTGCGMMPQGDKTAQSNTSGGSGVLSRMRPKANEQTIEELKAQEAKAREEQIKLAQAAAKQQQGANLNGLGRVLPPVSTDPIAPPAEAVAADGPVVNNYNPGAAMAAQGNSNDKKGAKIDSKSMTPAKDAMLPAAGAGAPEAATYSQSYQSTSVPPPPPGAVAGRQLVPPPPAVTLSTNANLSYGGPGDNPYANPYFNPYAVPNPYQQYPQYPYMMPPPQQPPAQEPQRPAIFGSGKKKQPRLEDDGGGEEDDAAAKPEKKQADFVPIRPVGMEARSPYKQKDDLKILWNGALNTYQMQRIIGKDEDLDAVLKRIDVGLPPDATKGMFTVPPRRVASIFRPIVSDKKPVEEIRKVQFDLVQAYYRYLYAYHKYALQQQTVAARKQEIEVASSNAEKQRAEADLARAQDAAQSATEDMRSAQEELAAVGGAQAARTIIGRVSGITPSIQSLAQAEKSAEPIEVDSKSGSIGGVFGLGKMFFGGGKKSAPAAVASSQDDASAPAERAEAGAPKAHAKDKGGLSLFGHKSKDKKDKPSKNDDDDLAPQEHAAKPRTIAKAPKSDPGMPPVSPKASPSSPISFELKDVEITARKSILTVTVHNGGSETFRLSPDVISIAEGDKKISEAAMRAEFDSTSVKPNGEVKGKITIFGRPWNDRLIVSISDGSNNIQLKRNH